MTATLTYTMFLGIIYLIINVGRELAPNQHKKQK